MIFTGLEETVIRDILDIMKDGVDAADDIGLPTRGANKLQTSASLSKATEGLILIFPHLCTVNLSPETAQTLTRAIETKAVTLLQIAFSAFNITNSTDAVDFVRQFHTNVGSGRMSIDRFIDTMDSISTESTVTRAQLTNVLREFSKMECYFEEDLNEHTVNDFNVVNRYGNYIITEAPLTRKTYRRIYVTAKDAATKEVRQQMNADNAKAARIKAETDAANAEEMRRHNKAMENLSDRQAANQQQQFDDQLQQRRDEFEYTQQRDETRDDFERRGLDLKERDLQRAQAKDEFDRLTRQLLPTDIKKANDMIPTMMIINFTTRDEELGHTICSSAVIGVKAKLYPASSDDIINKIIVKNADNQVFLKLMRVSTRELNFVRDFLLAVDDAKLAAISCSSKGSDVNRMLKVLERRAVKSKVRRRLGMNNPHKAITTITITKDEADYIKKYKNIDVFSPNTIRGIMESLNIMMFIVADETEECAHIIMDSGDDMYERVTFDHLDRESADGSYKKAINLMTKVVR